MTAAGVENVDFGGLNEFLTAGITKTVLRLPEKFVLHAPADLRTGGADDADLRNYDTYAVQLAGRGVTFTVVTNPSLLDTLLDLDDPVDPMAVVQSSRLIFSPLSPWVGRVGKGGN